MSDSAIAPHLTGPAPGEARIFDFRRPNKLNRDHLRNLQIVHETFARQFSTVLSSTLRAISHVSVESIDQVSYDEYVRSTPNPTFLAVLSMAPWTGTSAFQMPLKIALTAIDFLLGGHGKGFTERSLTEIELGIMKHLIDRAMAELTYAFNSVTEVNPTVVRHESNPQFAEIAAPSEMMISVTFHIKINDEEGTATLCYPYTAVQPVLESFSGNLAQVLPSGVKAIEATARLERAVLDVPIDFQVQFPPVRLPAPDIAALRPGDVIPFGITTDQPITALVGGVPTYVVRPARKNKRMACQVLSVVPGAEASLERLIDPLGTGSTKAQTAAASALIDNTIVGSPQ